MPGLRLKVVILICRHRYAMRYQVSTAGLVRTVAQANTNSYASIRCLAVRASSPFFELLPSCDYGP